MPRPISQTAPGSAPPRPSRMVSIMMRSASSPPQDRMVRRGVAPYFSFGLLALRCGNRNLNHTSCTLCGIVTHLAHGSRPHATDTVARTSCRRPHWCHPRLFAILGSAPPRTHSLVHLGAHYGAHRGASLAAARWWLIMAPHRISRHLPTNPETDCAHHSWQPPPQQPSLLCE